MCIHCKAIVLLDFFIIIRLTVCIHCKAIVLLDFFIIIIIPPLFERLLRGDRYT